MPLLLSVNQLIRMHQKVSNETFGIDREGDDILLDREILVAAGTSFA